MDSSSPSAAEQLYSVHITFYGEKHEEDYENLPLTEVQEQLERIHKDGYLFVPMFTFGGGIPGEVFLWAVKPDEQKNANSGAKKAAGDE